MTAFRMPTTRLMKVITSCYSLDTAIGIFILLELSVSHPLFLFCFSFKGRESYYYTYIQEKGRNGTAGIRYATKEKKIMFLYLLEKAAWCFYLVHFHVSFICSFLYQKKSKIKCLHKRIFKVKIVECLARK